MNKIRHIHRGISLEATMWAVEDGNWGWSVTVLRWNEPADEGRATQAILAKVAAFDSGKRMIDAMLKKRETSG